jgi:curved DNA-binding protein CbpA
MPLRPQTIWRPLRTPFHLNSLTPPHPRPSCLHHRHPLLAYQFHTSPPYLTDNALPNHYETLSLPLSATPKEIKTSFFALSKKHHPDKNPNDPTASTRFVAISEAYHVLSVPEKRAQYDAQIEIQGGRGRGRNQWGEAPAHGSYSSSSFAGSRPASGLNKKRSTFRGPPPSFYKAGGYGAYGAKRAEYAYSQPQGEERGEKEAGPESYGEYGGGFGPGEAGLGHEVPHFDDLKHKRTHDHINEHIYARRRKTMVREVSDEVDRGGMLINFLLVTGAIGVIAFTTKVFADKTAEKEKKDAGTHA